jgi:predicted PurR-regulated permease PerM
MNSAVTEIPTWWLILSGIFFALVALLFLVLCMLVGKLITVVAKLEPQVSSLITKVDELVPAVKGLVEKVDHLTVKVEAVADSTKLTIDKVGGNARSIASAADTIVTAAAQRFQQFAPLLGTLMAGMRIFNMYREYKGHSHETKKVTVEVAALPAKDGAEHAKKG